MYMKQILWVRLLFFLLILCILFSCGEKSDSSIENLSKISSEPKNIADRFSHLTDIEFMVEELPPFNYTADGEVRGCSVDLLLESMRAINCSLERSDIKSLPWARAYDIVQNEPRKALFSMARTAQREKLFKWVGPIVDVKIGVLALKSSSVTLPSLERVVEYKIGSVISSAPEQLLLKQSKVLKSQLVRVANPIQSIQMLSSGRIDLFPFNIPTAMHLIKELGLSPDDFEVVYTLKDTELYYAFSNDTADQFISDLNDALLKVKEAVSTKKTMVISGHPDYPPFMWKSGGAIVGIGAELAEMICEELNVPYENKYIGPWKRVQENSRLGSIDLIVAIYKNENREVYLDYTIPYKLDPTSVAVRKGSKFAFKSRSDLVGLTGVTMHGDSFGQDLDDYINNKLNIQRAHNSEAIFKNLISARVDYILWGRYPILTNASRFGVSDKLRVLSPPVAVENMFMAFSKKSQFKKLLPQVNKIIKRLRSDGTIDRLSQKYLHMYQKQFGAGELKK